MPMRLAEIAGLFPEVPVQSRGSSTMESLGINPKKYLCMGIVLSLLAFIVVLTACLLAGLEHFLGISLLGLAASLALLLALPEAEARKRAAAVESEMPFFLRSAGMLMEMGIPFEKAVHQAAEGPMKRETEKIARSAGNGMSMQNALSSFASSLDSLAVKRAVSQLVSAYEIGSSGREMQKIGNELLDLEKHRFRQYASKSALLGLVFIISSAVLPTFFLVYAVIGRYVFGAALGEPEIALGLLAVFPAMSAMILAVSKAIVPASSLSAKTALKPYIALPGILLIAGTLVEWLQVPAMLLAFLVSGHFLYRDYAKEKKAEEIEAVLPDALFSVSGLPKSTPPERLFRVIENGGFGKLSVEAGASRRQLENNVKLETALDDLWQRNQSPLLRRAALMIKQMFRTNSLDRLSMLAEDIIGCFQMQRERSQVFSMQKYTLVFGALLVPVIMKTALSLLESMGSLIDEASVAGAVEFSYSVVPSYLIIYAMISSVAIADAEGKGSSAAIYFLLLAVAGLAAFHFISF
ncbi:hypothetical protein GF318_03820 [Candidatus Micrarchaeota archaeon]|nr:hypothetical protein [Candidatus Micrarchaeota archaeon]